jgi:hypothetical protein
MVGGFIAAEMKQTKTSQTHRVKSISPLMSVTLMAGAREGVAALRHEDDGAVVLGEREDHRRQAPVTRPSCRWAA